MSKSRLKNLSAVFLLGSALIFSSLAQCQETTGHDLMTKSDCMTCHKLDMKLVGPSFQEIAAKYKGQAEATDKLVEKVIAGGTGNWGQIPMTPHPALAKEDVKKMVEWILSQAK